jgi:putative endonuclease
LKEYFVYIITNAGKTVLYTGMTNDLTKRLTEHKAAEDIHSFTGRYNVNRLLYYERYQNAATAIAREKEIKGWRRAKKVRLIETENPYWRFLDAEEEY